MKQKSTLILFFAITFLLGSVVGYMLKDPIQKLSQSSVEQVRTPNSPEERVRAEQRMRNYMIRELSLEEDQIEVFFAVMHQRRRAMRVIMDSSRTETNQRIRIQADSLNLELQDILTDDQFAKWDKMQERYRRPRGQRDGPGRP
jgi:hypothetical protein